MLGSIWEKIIFIAPGLIDFVPFFLPRPLQIRKSTEKNGDFASATLFSDSFRCKWQHLLCRNQRRLIAPRRYRVITAPAPYDLSNQLLSILKLCKSNSFIKWPAYKQISVC